MLNKEMLLQNKLISTKAQKKHLKVLGGGKQDESEDDDQFNDTQSNDDEEEEEEEEGEEGDDDDEQETSLLQHLSKASFGSIETWDPDHDSNQTYDSEVDESNRTFDTDDVIDQDLNSNGTWTSEEEDLRELEQITPSDTRTFHPSDFPDSSKQEKEKENPLKHDPANSSFILSSDSQNNEKKKKKDYKNPEDITDSSTEIMHKMGIYKDEDLYPNVPTNAVLVDEPDPEFPDEIRKVQYVFEKDWWAKPLSLDLKDVIKRVDELRILGGTANLRDAALICHIVLEVLEEEIMMLEIFDGMDKDPQKAENFLSDPWDDEHTQHYIRGAGPNINSRLYDKLYQDAKWYERQDIAERKSGLMGIHFCVCLALWLPGQYQTEIEMNLEWAFNILQGHLDLAKTSEEVRLLKSQIASGAILVAKHIYIPQEKYHIGSLYLSKAEKILNAWMHSLKSGIQSIQERNGAIGTHVLEFMKYCVKELGMLYLCKSDVSWQQRLPEKYEKKPHKLEIPRLNLEKIREAGKYAEKALEYFQQTEHQDARIIHETRIRLIQVCLELEDRDHIRGLIWDILDVFPSYETQIEALPEILNLLFNYRWFTLCDQLLTIYMDPLTKSNRYRDNLKFFLESLNLWAYTLLELGQSEDAQSLWKFNDTIMSNLIPPLTPLGSISSYLQTLHTGAIGNRWFLTLQTKRSPPQAVLPIGSILHVHFQHPTQPNRCLTKVIQVDLPYHIASGIMIEFDEEEGVRLIHVLSPPLPGWAAGYYLIHIEIFTPPYQNQEPISYHRQLIYAKAYNDPNMENEFQFGPDGEMRPKKNEDQEKSDMRRYRIPDIGQHMYSAIYSSFVSYASAERELKDFRQYQRKREGMAITNYIAEMNRRAQDKRKQQWYAWNDPTYFTMPDKNDPALETAEDSTGLAKDTYTGAEQHETDIDWQDTSYIVSDFTEWSQSWDEDQNIFENV